MEEMDWNEIRETGHACYNCSHLKERKRYWIFLLRTYFHQREMEGLQLFFHETPIRARIRAGMPCLMEQATRAFFYKGASFADRIALIKQHIIHLETHLTDDFLLKIYEAHDKITLWADTFEEKPLTMDLLFHPGQRKEGCLSLVLHWGSLDFYQMMFWFGLSPET